MVKMNLSLLQKSWEVIFLSYSNRDFGDKRDLDVVISLKIMFKLYNINDITIISNKL